MSQSNTIYVSDNSWLSSRGYTPILMVHGRWEKWFPTNNGLKRLEARVLEPVQDIINRELDLYK